MWFDSEHLCEKYSIHPNVNPATDDTCTILGENMHSIKIDDDSQVNNPIENEMPSNLNSSSNHTIPNENLKTDQSIDGSMQINSSPGTTIQPSDYPYVEIIEQPASNGLRFRYECEGRSNGSIPGANSTMANRSYPTIRVRNFQGDAKVVVSCSTLGPPFRPHPHSLVGSNCKQGVCEVIFNNETMTKSFPNLAIQCVKKAEINKALQQRESNRIDPFGTGHESTQIDLNVICLCFHVFIGNQQTGCYTSLQPVVSSPIYDRKTTRNLMIYELSKPSSSVLGNDKIILLCGKVDKNDIEIRIFDENGWECFVQFKPSDVHYQVAITFFTPEYKAHEIIQPVNCWLQLRRKSDGATSVPIRFEYHPVESGSQSRGLSNTAPNDQMEQMSE